MYILVIVDGCQTYEKISQLESSQEMKTNGYDNHDVLLLHNSRHVHKMEKGDKAPL